MVGLDPAKFSEAAKGRRRSLGIVAPTWWNPGVGYNKERKLGEIEQKSWLDPNHGNWLKDLAIWLIQTAMSVGEIL